jgi:hypothetical protein
VPVPLIGVTLRRQRKAHNRRRVPQPLALCGAEPGPRRVGQQGPGMGVVESFWPACRSKGHRWAAFGLADRDSSQLGFVGQLTADRRRARGSFAARFPRPLSAHDEPQRFGVRISGVWDTALRSDGSCDPERFSIPHETRAASSTMRFQLMRDAGSFVRSCCNRKVIRTSRRFGSGRSFRHESRLSRIRCRTGGCRVNDSGTTLNFVVDCRTIYK